MNGLTVDVDIDPDEDLFGYTVDDLQSNIRVKDGAILGNLKYIADYSSAFGPDMDQGNYLALHCSVPGVEGVTIKVTVNQESTLDSDGLVVCYIGDKNSQTVKVVASKDGYDSVTKEFVLNGLTVATA